MTPCPFCPADGPATACCSGCGLAVCGGHWHHTGDQVWPAPRPLGECPDCAERRAMWGTGDKAWDDEAVLMGRLKALEE